MNQKAELKDRFDAKVLKMEARIKELRADGRRESREMAKDMEKQISDFAVHTREGFDKVTDKIAGKINEWLSSS